MKILGIVGHSLFWMVLSGVIAAFQDAVPASYAVYLVDLAKAAGVVAVGLMDPSTLAAKIGLSK